MILSKRIFLIIEIAVLFSAVEIYIWQIRYMGQPLKKIFMVCMIVYMIVSWIMRNDSLITLGLKPLDWNDTEVIGKITYLNIGLMLIIGLLFRSESFGFSISVFANLIWYIFWGTLQQIIIHSYFTNRLLEILPNRFVVCLLAGCMFSIVHWPNPALTVICLINGIIGAYFFSKSRNIWLLGFSHAFIGIFVSVLLPYDWHHALRIGPSF